MRIAPHESLYEAVKRLVEKIKSLVFESAKPSFIFDLAKSLTNPI